MQVSDFTLNDINVGSKLYGALVSHAKNHPGEPIFYSDLLELARQANRADDEIQRAVPIGIGPKLLFVQLFCDANNYPNLACLAVNRSTGRPGESYTGDWEREKQQVATFDWSQAAPELIKFYESVKKEITPRKRIKEEPAREMVWQHFAANRGAYVWSSKEEEQENKQEIVNLVMEGFEAAEAFRRVLGK